MISKLVAGREKDLRFARDAATCGLVDRAALHERLEQTPLASPGAKRLLEGRISALFEPPA